MPTRDTRFVLTDLSACRQDEGTVTRPRAMHVLLSADDNAPDRIDLRSAGPRSLSGCASAAAYGALRGRNYQ